MPTHINFNTEDEMIEAASDVFSAMGIPCYVAVPCFSRCIDMVAVIKNNIVAIEFKLHDWRRGLAQAEHHLIAVDNSFVCLPPRQVTELMRKTFEQSEVGLLMFDINASEPFQQVFPAKNSSRKWSIGEKWLRETLGIEGQR
ncbi:MAG: hypothetical protein AB2448_11315 [Moorella sp. (in: firmicutes)]